MKQRSSSSTSGGTPLGGKPRKARRLSKAQIEQIRRKYDGVTVPGQLTLDGLPAGDVTPSAVQATSEEEDRMSEQPDSASTDEAQTVDAGEVEAGGGAGTETTEPVTAEPADGGEQADGGQQQADGEEQAQ